MKPLLIICIAALGLAACGEESVENAAETVGKKTKDVVETAKERIASLDIPDGVPGMPELPVLSGDYDEDKAALAAALEELQSAWDRNRQRQAALLKKGVTTATAELKDIEQNNVYYQRMANALQDLIDEMR